MLMMHIKRSFGNGILASLLVFGLVPAAPATTVLPPSIVSNESIRVYLRDEPQGPRLEWMEESRRDGVRPASWSNDAPEPLPASAEINGIAVPLTWKKVADSGQSGGTLRKVVFVYESAEPHLRLRWEWEARAGFGPVEHRIIIENLSDQEIWLPMVDSLRLDWRTKSTQTLRNLYVEKGADSPSAEGTHDEAMGEDYNWTGKSTTYAHPVPGEKREIIPAEIVYAADGARSGWFAGIEFSGRVRISLVRAGNEVKSVLGLDPDPGTFKTRLEPGESFTPPSVFLGAFSGGPDAAGNQLRPWVRQVLGNPLTWKDPHYPLLVNNSWGSGMQVDEALALKMIGESKELGLEMFHLDAGWFRGVGDWYPDPKKFPHGLTVLADEAHRQGLRFGIWTDWTQAALDTEPGALNVNNPTVHDWLVSDMKADWKPEDFKGQTIDIGVPAAHDWAAKEVKRIVEDYRLDMLEHDGYLVAQGCIRTDHPHAPPNRSTMRIIHDWASDFVLASNSTDVSYHAVRAYYDIYEQTRREHPGLLFEICNDGGRMVDFGSAAHGDYFSITDTYDPLSNRRAFYDASHLLPPAMLESYVEKWPTPRPENFLYMLRSGMMGWLTIMTDTIAWTPEQHEAARQAISLYKSELRPLIRDAKLYHVSDRPDGVHWDAIEYYDSARGKGVVYAFRGSVADEPEHRFRLEGLQADTRYRLHFADGGVADRVATGSELMGPGLKVSLPHSLSSAFVFLNRSTTRIEEVSK
jgi:disulfide oxidoreductase YuzD